MPDGTMMKDDDMAQGQMNQESTKAIEVGNKICPVSGEKVPAPGEKGEMGEAVKYEYNGKIYNLCCPMCVKDFKKNPEKYSAIAEKEVKEAK
jgi:YHS domain-containing protein